MNQKERKQHLNTQGNEKKNREQKVVENNSRLLLSGKFDFDPKEILDKSLLFDLQKTSEEKNFLIRYLKKYRTKMIFFKLSIGRERTYLE